MKKDKEGIRAEKRKEAADGRQKILDSLLDVYVQAELKMKIEDEQIFVGLRVVEDKSGSVSLQQEFKQFEPGKSRRFNYAMGNVKRSTLIATVCGQLCGAADRCMFGNVLPSMVLVLGCLRTCGFSKWICTLGAERLLKCHGYLRREVEMALVEAFGY